jgi:hypothetical protein
MAIKTGGSFLWRTELTANVRQKINDSWPAGELFSLRKIRRELSMSIPKFKLFSSLMLAISLLAFSAIAVTAQDTTATVGARTVVSGQKMKIKGVVVRRDSDTFIVRDANGVDTTVRLEDRTSVKANGGFLRSGSNYAQTQILRGLNLEVEGRGNASG